MLDGPAAKEQEGVDTIDSEGTRRRCPLCGTTKRSERDLRAHVQLLHPQYAQHFLARTVGRSSRAAAPHLNSSRQEGGAGAGAVHTSSSNDDSSTAGASAGHSSNSNDGGATTESKGGGTASSSSAASEPSEASLQSVAKSQGSASGTPGTSASQGRLWARNTSRRTLGRVLLYHNSLGQPRVPPVGHQLSLKYSLMQEGVEVRAGRAWCEGGWGSQGM